jgi:hypothetical protein
MGVLDFRRFMPGVIPPDGGFINVPTSGPGTFSVPVQSDGAPQQDPPPAEPEKPLVTPRPPIMTGVGGLGVQTRVDPPTSPLTPVTPPTQTLPAPTGRPGDTVPAYGPGASQPSVTGAPTKPIEPAFNPDVREAVRKATPPGGTAATQAGNSWDDWIKRLKDPKMGPAIAALAKGFGAAKGPAPPGPYSMHMIGPTNPGFNQPNVGGAQQQLQQLMEGGIGAKAQKAWEKKKSQRRSEQDRYDILGGRG